ncbi:unnamed protein product, partial [Didymodactylos carnosus]
KPPSITSTLINNYNRHLSQPIFPLYLSQQTFFKMLHTSDSRQWSKLEFFLASSTIVRQFARAVAEPVDQNNITIRAVNNEPDTYRMEHLALQLQFIFDKISGLYRIKFTTTEQAPIASQQQQCLWLYDELQTLDTFFNEIFFTIYPLPMAIDIISLHSTANRGTVVATLQKLFTFIQSKILKDLIKIMRLEQNPDPQHMWRARWCLTVPSGNGFAQVGNPSIGCGPNRHVYIFVFQFIPRTEMQLPNATTFIVPLQYDLQTNLTNLWDTSKATSMYVERKLVDVSRLVEGVKQTLSTKKSFWHLIDLNHTLTLEHVWKSLCHPSNKTTNEIMFQCNDNANLMPLSSSVHLLNNNDKLKIVPLEADSNKTLTQNVESFTKVLKQDDEHDEQEDNEEEEKELKKMKNYKPAINAPISKFAPLEKSSKRRTTKKELIPVHLRNSKKIFDPRFDERCGEYDARTFRRTYNFITDLRSEELVTMKTQLKNTEDPNERLKIKQVIQRLKTQIKNVEDFKKEEELHEEIKTHSKEIAKDGQATPYISKDVKKVIKLATKYTDLKKSGKVDAYLSQKRKRLASKQKSKLPFRRPVDDEME